FDADVAVRRSAGVPDASPDIHVQLNRTDGLSVLALSGRLGLDLRTGSLLCDVPGSGPAQVQASQAAIALTFDGADSGQAVLDGSFAIDRATGSPRAPAAFEARLDNWDFVSPLIPPLVKSLGDTSAETQYRELDPSGEFRAGLSLKDAPHGPGTPAGRVLLT